MLLIVNQCFLMMLSRKIIVRKTLQTTNNFFLVKMQHHEVYIWMNQITKWKHTYNSCIRKFTLSDLKRNIWTWTGIQNSDFWHENQDSSNGRAPGWKSGGPRFESWLRFKFFSWDLIMWMKWNLYHQLGSQQESTQIIKMTWLVTARF